MLRRSTYLIEGYVERRHTHDTLGIGRCWYRQGPTCVLLSLPELPYLPVQCLPSAFHGSDIVIESVAVAGSHIPRSR